MFGFVRKKKILDLVNNGLNELDATELKVVNLEEEVEFKEYVNSLNRIKGGRTALNCIKRHLEKM